ncbi:MAG: lipocalin family protein [Bacteroidetes bacterium]|nr:lipocalin family protein [Bacteroidota bacterium]
MKKLFFPLAALALFAVACSKKDTKSAKDNLTNGNWYYRAYTERTHGTGFDSTVDQFAKWMPCVKDNYLNFNANGTFTMNEGPLKCDTSDPQIQTGTWMLINNDSKLVTAMPPSATPDTITILSLDGSTMRLFDSYTSGGVTTDNTITLGH